jgi:hypothetical protein
MHCHSPSPRVQLAKALERIWSTLATNRQGLPFCGPLLPGIDRIDKDQSKGDKEMHLFKILSKIRQLEYNDAQSFAQDIDTMVQEASTLLAGRSQPLLEAAKTLQIICMEKMKSQKKKLDKIHTLLSHEKKENKIFIWPIAWRQECLPFESLGILYIDAKSLEEWTSFITSTPVFSQFETKSNETTKNALNVESYNQMKNKISENPGFGDLSLPDGLDIMTALSELGNSCARGRPLFGGLLEEQLEEINARDFFLSPSTSEMEQMFQQQSQLLRKTLESHAALQKSWLLSKRNMLSADQDNNSQAVFSLAEGRLAAELRIANKVSKFGDV